MITKLALLFGGLALLSVPLIWALALLAPTVLFAYFFTALIVFLVGVVTA